MLKNRLNTKYIKILGAVFQNLPDDKYIVLGSAATLSFTSKIGYERKMNDLDVIVDVSVADKIKKILIKKGFKQSSFINKRMPFYSKLITYSNSVYLRFSNSEINVELLLTKFREDDRNLKFDLYPNIWVEIPVKSLIKTKFGYARFISLEINLLWAVVSFLNNTLGRFVLYKKDQRNMDHRMLRKNVNLVTARKLLSKCRFGYKQFSFRVPVILIK